MRTKTSRIFLCIMLLSALAFVFVAPMKVAHADITLSAPSWWVDNNNQFSQCDTYQYHYGHTWGSYPGTGVDSSPLQYNGANASFEGIVACGPRPESVSTPDAQVQFTPTGNHVGEFECTELVFRYLYLKFGALMEGSTDGSQVVDHYTTDYPNLFTKVTNDGTHHIKVGDVLSYYSPDNHTAIVINTSNVNGSGNGSITVLEQNASSSGESSQDVSGWVIKNGVDNSSTNGDTVSAWLTPHSWNTVTSPTPSGSTYLKAIASTSTSDAWAVGTNIYLGTTSAVAYHWNGTWGSTNTITSGAKLTGVSEISSSNVLAVGSLTSPSTQTAAYHYDGTSWSSVGSNTPGSNPYFTAVSSDTGGDAWAVGTTTNGGTNNIIIEKYAGSSTGFQNWTLTSGQDTTGTAVIGNVSGSTDNELFAIATASSPDAWAVGYYQDSSGNYIPLIYHYDGSSWTQKAAPTFPTGVYGAILRSVVEISSNDVYAVGNTREASGVTHGYIIHWDGSNWNNVISTQNSVSDVLYGVSAVSTSEVYAVGETYSGSTGIPFTLTYNSIASWQQVPSPAGNSGDSFLSGVTSPSAGQALSAGQYSNGPTNTFTQQFS